MSTTLREFIAKTIEDIIDGVLDAQKHREGKGVAPWGIGAAKYPPESGLLSGPYAPLTVVKFDVAVTAELADAQKAGTGLKIYVLSAAAEMRADAKHTEATRVQFSVPVMLPAGDRNKPEADTQ